jgi:predicted nucleic acid-binding protein
MANIFLDTNTFIDIVSERKSVRLEDYQGHQLFISALSVHILCYVLKTKVPSQKIEAILSFFTIVPLNESIVLSSMKGPTGDFEDNVQLHSAAESECICMVTRDSKLLKLIYFGKTQLVEKM